MKKLIRNNKGFTLAELVVAGGLAGVIALVAVTSLRNTRQASNITVVGSEASTLKSLIAAQLVNPAGCKKTFPDNTPVARNNIKIFSSGGAVVAQTGSTFGPKKEFKIADISSSSAVGSNILTVRVKYDLRGSLDKAGKKSYEFTLDLFVNKNAANLITGCFVDIAGATRKAVQYSCKGWPAVEPSPPGAPERESGAHYDSTVGLYGTCTHDLPEVRNAAGAKVITNLCPTGQYLKRVTVENTPTYPKNTVVLECQPFSVGPCPAWSYVNKVNGTTGAADCVSLSQYFNPGQVITTVNSKVPTYLAINLDCTNPDEVVRSIRTDGTPECIPKHIETLCGPNQYVSDIVRVSSSQFQGVCKNFVKVSGGCPANQYLQAVQSDGAPTAGGCVPQTLPATCGASEVMTGLNANGTAKCVVND